MHITRSLPKLPQKRLCLYLKSVACGTSASPETSAAKLGPITKSEKSIIMYDLPYHKEKNEQVIKEFIGKYPFAFLSGCESRRCTGS